MHTEDIDFNKKSDKINECQYKFHIIIVLYLLLLKDVIELLKKKNQQIIKFQLEWRELFYQMVIFNFYQVEKLFHSKIYHFMTNLWMQPNLINALICVIQV